MFEMRLVFICTISFVCTVSAWYGSLPEILRVVISKALKTPGKQFNIMEYLRGATEWELLA